MSYINKKFNNVIPYMIAWFMLIALIYLDFSSILLYLTLGSFSSLYMYTRLAYSVVHSCCMAIDHLFLLSPISVVSLLVVTPCAHAQQG